MPPAPRLPHLLAVGAVAFLVYANTLAGDFVLDDVPAIAENRLVHAPRGLGEIFRTQYWDASIPRNLYRPLVLLTYVAEYRAWGDEPAGYHATNALLHAVNSCLVVLLAAAVLASAPAAFVAGLLFAVHPIHVEAVANVTGRPDLMATTFVLLFLVLRVRARAGSGVRRAVLEAGGAAAYVVALFCKESAVVAPGLALLVDAALEHRAGRGAGGQAGAAGGPAGAAWWAWARRQAVPLAAWIAVTAAYLVLRRAVLGTVTLEFRTFDALGLTRAERLAAALAVFADQLRLLVVPAPLIAMRAINLVPQTVAQPAATAAGAALIAVGLPVAVIISGRGRGTVAFAALWVAFSMLPTSNLLIPLAVLQADRLLYLPSVGAAVLLGALAVRAGSGPDRTGIPSRGVTALRTLLASALVALAGLTVLRNEDWQSRARLYSDCARQEPDSPWAWMALSGLFLEANQAGAAERAAGRALELLPDYGPALENRGLARMRLGRSAEAFADLSRSMQRVPTPRKAVALGLLLAEGGRAAEAEAQLRGAAAGAPDDALVLTGLGTFLARAGRPAEALPFLERAVTVAPGNLDARINLGLARVDTGDARGAGDLGAAAAAAAGDASVLYRAGVGLARAGQGDAAIACLQEAIRADPAFARAYDALGLALARAGRLPEARKLGDFMRARGIAPGPEFASWLEQQR